MNTMLQEILSHKLDRQISLIQNKNLYPFMDWAAFGQIVMQELLPYIIDDISEALEQKEESNRKLRAKLNQLKFGNNPERDRKIIELRNQGSSKRGIAKLVGMTPWGISLALRRLGVK